MKFSVSPKHIAAYSASAVSICCGILAFLTDLSIPWVLGFIGLSFTVGFFIFSLFLDRFIYRKIKVIYKSINRIKKQSLVEEQMSKDPISEVSGDILAWAKARNAEIAELKEQESFRREFVGNVSHELKTPIFQMQGYLHTLLEGALSDPKVNYHFLQKSADSADRLAELVNDLTNINQIESGKLKMDKTKFDLVELIKEVLDGIDLKLTSRNVTASISNLDELSGNVFADRSRIKQVLTNLIINAIKYGKENGKVKCKIYDMDKHVLVEVADDGEGIAPEHLPRLFERFYRVEQSRTRDQGGSGLGLSIAKHVLEAHGENLKVRSEVGKGTTFGFTLPKAIT